MSEPEAETIDLLDALGEGVEDLLAAIQATEESSAYLEGQVEFFEATLAAIPEAGSEERPQAVLEDVAAELGVELADAELQATPLEPRRAGVLGAWGICIGYLEGFHAGANRVIEGIEQAPAGPGGEPDEV